MIASPYRNGLTQELMKIRTVLRSFQVVSSCTLPYTYNKYVTCQEK